MLYDMYMANDQAIHFIDVSIADDNPETACKSIETALDCIKLADLYESKPTAQLGIAINNLGDVFKRELVGLFRRFKLIK